MGRRGYVQVRAPKYGSAITDWAQSSFCSYLEDNGLEIGIGESQCLVEDADKWDIEIPARTSKDGKRLGRNLAKIREMIADLRAHPDKITGYTRGEKEEYGEAAARLLEEGLAAAVRERSDFITIWWW